jgi:hypothetical protein
MSITVMDTGRHVHAEGIAFAAFVTSEGIGLPRQNTV